MVLTPMVKSGMAEGGSKNPARVARGRIIRSSTSPGATASVLLEILALLEEGLDDDPREQRVRIRDIRAALLRDNPQLRANATDIAQAMADEDGQDADW